MHVRSGGGGHISEEDMLWDGGGGVRERMFVEGEACFLSAGDPVGPSMGLDASALRCGHANKAGPFWAVGCLWNRKLSARAQQSTWKFQFHMLRINL